MIDRFHFIVDRQGNFITMDIDNNVIESPVPIKTIKDAYKVGLMAFVRQNKRWKKIPKEVLDGPWNGSKKDWDDYYLIKSCI